MDEGLWRGSVQRGFVLLFMIFKSSACAYGYMPVYEKKYSGSIPVTMGSEIKYNDSDRESI